MANLTLLTDLYEITMAQGYWREGKVDEQSCFYMFYRENPFEGGYGIMCGGDQVVELIDNFGFGEEDIAYLRSLPAPDGKPLFDPEFLDWLYEMELEVNVDIVPDGTIVFPREPLVRVTGPLLQCQLLEPAILNGVNFQTLIATKASRICRAAQGRPVAEFGLRRAQGPDGAMSSSRAAYIGGCASVANVLAGKRYGIPISGTHAHSWVMAFDDELTAFRAYVEAMPGNAVLLVDTYNVEQGVKNAITVGLEMRERGEKLSAIRIDSGDLAWLSKKARQMLDDAGLTDCGIVLSNDLDEYTIQSLNEQGASYTALGVGTHLSTAFGQPALGGVYKLSAVRGSDDEEWSPRLKLSEQTYKLTIPGVLDTRRYYDSHGMFAGDVVVDTSQPIPEIIIAVDPLDAMKRKPFGNNQSYEELLVPLACGGCVVEDYDTDARHARERCQEQLSRVDNSIKRFHNPHEYPAGLERSLFQRRRQMIIELRGADELY